MSLLITFHLPSIALQKRAVILLDGFDHLQSLPGAADLHWLPTSFPSNVSVVVSVAPGRYELGRLCVDLYYVGINLALFRTLEILSSTPDRHGWKQFEMQPLQAAARRALVDRTLAKVGK